MNDDLYTTYEGKNLIKSFEGFDLRAYKDMAGIWTIGWGSTRNVTPNLVINLEQAEERFAVDLAHCETVVKKFIKVKLNVNQFSSLVSFIFNLGSGNFLSSTLLKRLHEGQIYTCANEFLRWIYYTDSYGKKRVAHGLVIRRAEERALFLKS